ncbi:hypothetical protein RJ639_037728 [Escallonia herrerae]|uniref:EF-hand domain-containing protein n=1 Tax=Escallonia herrerae TaxID=1293975 RepID=A0AA89B7K9_9ASTE|nr:hypothetical protein RJ639_037728 [Escallonia herrerae]
MVEDYNVEVRASKPTTNVCKGAILPPTTAHKREKVPLTEEQLRLWFKKYDTNQDGNLTWAELMEAFRKLGSHWGGFRAMQAKVYADANGDGCISKDEMEELVRFAYKRNRSLERRRKRASHADHPAATKPKRKAKRKGENEQALNASAGRRHRPPAGGNLSCNPPRVVESGRDLRPETVAMLVDEGEEGEERIGGDMVRALVTPFSSARKC